MSKKDPKNVIRRWSKKARWLGKSLALWGRRAAYRRARLALHERRESFRFQRWAFHRETKPEDHPLRAKWWALYMESREAVLKWEALVDEAEGKVSQRTGELAYAERVLARHKAKLAEAKPGLPRVVVLDLPGESYFGALGWVERVIGHYSAGPTDVSLSDGLRLLKLYNAAHRAKRWGMIGYHIAFLRCGTIVLLRPFAWKGAHTALTNTGSLGVLMPGGPDDEPTPEQAESFALWLDNAHTDAFPESHRAPRRLTEVQVFGHDDFTATACPGEYKALYVSRGQSR